MVDVVLGSESEWCCKRCPLWLERGRHCRSCTALPQTAAVRLNSTHVSCPTLFETQKRTPVGSFNGALKKLTAPELGAAAIKAAVASAGIEPSCIEDVYMGNVLQAAIGQSPARQAAIKAGLGNDTEATTINKVDRTDELESLKVRLILFVTGLCFGNEGDYAC